MPLLIVPRRPGSLYFADPDGNRIELYIDQSDVWKRDPSAVASYKPLTL